MSTIISSFALADFEIPNQFEDGQVTSASQMNENFQALKAEIEILKTQMEEKQGSRWALVGVTEEKFNGADGFTAMGKACDRMLAGSYICNYNTLMTSTFQENVPISDAWLFDPSESSFWNCDRFTNASSEERSWGLRSDGIISIGMPCNSQIGVACCK